MRASASWLPAGKDAAVCFSIDDVHPATSRDDYEAGGDLERGVLSHLEHLLDRHPQLRPTLFVAADWRERSPAPTRRRLARVPGLRRRVFLARRYPRRSMSLDRHPEFSRYLSRLPRTEVALHGLHHVARGPRVPAEFERLGRSACRRRLERALEIFAAADLTPAPGLTPPGWSLTRSLADAAVDVGLRFVGSARDLVTPPAPGALTRMSGLHGVSLCHPQLIHGAALVHVTTNYQASSPPARAEAILDAGGVLAIKAHAVKDALGHVAVDGLDADYRDALDRLFSSLHRRYGERLLWANMSEVASRVHDAAARC